MNTKENDYPSNIKTINGIKCKPLEIYFINDTYILYVYQGNFSKFDLLLIYRSRDKKTKSGWGRPRKPKHIHWTVDLLIKMSHDRKTTQRFLNFLIRKWQKITAHKTAKQRMREIKLTNLLPKTEQEAKKFIKLNKYGEHSVKFLLMLAKLLMQQEKNNLKDAYMFKKLLDALKKSEDIHNIVSIATHQKRR